MPSSDPYHQKEIIRLGAAMPQSRRDLHRYLRGLGFKSEDDFYCLSRRGRIEPWQAINIIDISVGLEGKEEYITEHDIAEGAEDKWDQLTCVYLMAFLPRNYIADAVAMVAEISEHFALSAKYEGVEISNQDLLRRLEEIANRLSVECSEPGSEDLAVLIEL